MRMWVQSLASLSGLGIQNCHELWCSPAAVASIRLLVWELPYAAGVALKKQKKKKKKYVYFIKREGATQRVVKYLGTSFYTPAPLRIIASTDSH